MDKLEQTKTAMEELEKRFYTAKPESIVVIAQQSNILPESFSINLSPNYKANFKQFGDFGVELDFKSDYMAIQQIRAGDETNKAVPLVLTSEEEIDYSYAVPLYYLMQHAKDLPIIPVTYSGLGLEDHAKFGAFLKERLSGINKRFAVIASGDLSHKLTKEAPAGFSEKAAGFDKELLELFAKKDLAGLQKIDTSLLKEVEETALRQLIILLGTLGDMNYEPEQLSYEGPFGVGYAVVDCKLS